MRYTIKITYEVEAEDERTAESLAVQLAYQSHIVVIGVPVIESVETDEDEEIDA